MGSHRISIYLRYTYARTLHLYTKLAVVLAGKPIGHIWGACYLEKIARHL